MRGRGSTAEAWQRRVVSGGARDGIGGRMYGRWAGARGADDAACRAGDTDTGSHRYGRRAARAARSNGSPTTDGAIAATTYFLQLSDYGFASGDIAPLMAMSSAECSYCAYLKEQVDLQVAAHQTSEADPLKVLNARSTEIRPDEWFSAQLRVGQEYTRLIDAEGTKVSETGRALVD